MAEDLVKNIKNNWVLLVCIATLIANWTTSTNKISVVESKVATIEEKLEDINDIKESVARLETSVNFIKDQVK